MGKVITHIAIRVPVTLATDVYGIPLYMSAKVYKSKNHETMFPCCHLGFHVLWCWGTCFCLLRTCKMVLYQIFCIKLRGQSFPSIFQPSLLNWHLSLEHEILTCILNRINRSTEHIIFTCIWEPCALRININLIEWIGGNLCSSCNQPKPC